MLHLTISEDSRSKPTIICWIEKSTARSSSTFPLISMLVAWVVSGDLSEQCSKQSWSIGIPFVECRNGMMSLGWSTLLGMKMAPLSFNQWIIDGQSMISGNCEVWIFSELMEQHCILIVVMQWSIWVTPGMVNSCWIYVKKNCGTEGNLFFGGFQILGQ
jgi:hypothetical protein